MLKVLIIQAQMKQYRAPFFVKLGEALRRDGVRLRVAYSDPGSPDGRGDNCDLPPEFGLKVKGRWMFGERLLWQPLIREVAGADLIIAEQGNKYVWNYVLALVSTAGLRSVAFWGLGENKAHSRSEFSEWLRRRIINRVSWWFAYTPGTREYLVANGVAPGRIIVVSNAVDTHGFSELLDRICDEEVSRTKAQFGIDLHGKVGIFCGALSPDKGVEFLLEASKLIRRKLSCFHLIVVGGGPEREKVEAAAKFLPWIHYVGPKFGVEKAVLLKMADVLLVPGRVGLAILDGFAAGLPLLTTDLSFHGPEIEYLEVSKNGLITAAEPEAYAKAVVGLCSDAETLRSFRNHALRSSRENSMEAMVRNFSAGISMAVNSSGMISHAASRAG